MSETDQPRKEGKKEDKATEKKDAVKKSSDAGEKAKKAAVIVEASTEVEVIVEEIILPEPEDVPDEND